VSCKTELRMTFRPCPQPEGIVYPAIQSSASKQVQAVIDKPGPASTDPVRQGYPYRSSMRVVLQCKPCLQQSCYLRTALSHTVLRAAGSMALHAFVLQAWGAHSVVLQAVAWAHAAPACCGDACIPAQGLLRTSVLQALSYMQLSCKGACAYPVTNL
jgi:hypothetical protein